MKKTAPKYPQSRRARVHLARLINYLLSYDFALNLLILLAQIAMYGLALEAFHG